MFAPVLSNTSTEAKPISIPGPENVTGLLELLIPKYAEEVIGDVTVVGSDCNTVTGIVNFCAATGARQKKCFGPP